MVTVHYISRSSIEREWRRIYGVELPRDSQMSDVFTFIRNNAPARPIDVDASHTRPPPLTIKRTIESRPSVEDSESSNRLDSSTFLTTALVATKPKGAAVVKTKSRTDEKYRRDNQLPVRDNSDGMRNDCNGWSLVASQHPSHAKTPHRRLNKGNSVAEDRAIPLQRIALQSISMCSDDEQKERHNNLSLDSARMIQAQPNRREGVDSSASMIGGEERGNRISDERRKRPRAPSGLSAKAKRTKKHCDINLSVHTTSATGEKDCDGCNDDDRDSISPTNIMDVPDESHYTIVMDAPDEVHLPLRKQQVFTMSDDMGKSSMVRAKLPDKKSRLQEPGTNATANKSWDKRLEQLRQHFETHGDFTCQKDIPLWRWISDQRCLFRQIVLEGKQNNLSERRIELLNSIGFEWNVDEKVEDTDGISLCDDNGKTAEMSPPISDPGSTDISPSDEDVLLGRGGGTNKHHGNIQLRETVNKYRHLYNQAIKSDKSKILRKIVNTLRQANPPSRFLCLNKKTWLWEDVGDKRAAEKVGQLLRKNGEDEKIAKRTAFVENAVHCTEKKHVAQSFSSLIDGYVEDEIRRLGKSNGNYYVRKAGVDGVHNGQIMIRLKSKRYIIIDYGIPSEYDHELVQHHSHISIPPGAGQTLCKTVDCPHVGVPVLLYDSDPHEPMSLYMSGGLCFNCQRAFNEKRRTLRNKRGRTLRNLASADSSSSGNDVRIRYTDHLADQKLTQAQFSQLLDQDHGPEVPSLRTPLSLQRSNFQCDELGANTPRHLEELTNHPTEVISIVKELVWNVATNENNLCYRYHQSLLPQLLVGEYDAIIPLTPNGLLLNVGEVKKGRIAFLGYRQFPDGSKGPAELLNLVRRCGDLIIAVNGQSIVISKLDETLAILRRSTTFAFLRFVHHESMVDGGLTSCGSFTD